MALPLVRSPIELNHSLDHQELLLIISWVGSSFKSLCCGRLCFQIVLCWIGQVVVGFGFNLGQVSICLRLCVGSDFILFNFELSWILSYFIWNLIGFESRWGFQCLILFIPHILYLRFWSPNCWSESFNIIFTLKYAWRWNFIFFEFFFTIF